MREPRPSDWEQLVSTLLEDTDAALADVGEGPEAPQPDKCPSPRPGTRMLEIPPDSAGPVRQAGEAIERLRRRQKPRPSRRKEEKNS
jgi:hypothetical protein